MNTFKNSWKWVTLFVVAAISNSEAVDLNLVLEGGEIGLTVEGDPAYRQYDIEQCTNLVVNLPVWTRQAQPVFQRSTVPVFSSAFSDRTAAFYRAEALEEYNLHLADVFVDGTQWSYQECVWENGTLAEDRVLSQVVSGTTNSAGTEVILISQFYADSGLPDEAMYLDMDLDAGLTTMNLTDYSNMDLGIDSLLLMPAVFDDGEAFERAATLNLPFDIDGDVLAVELPLDYVVTNTYMPDLELETDAGSFLHMIQSVLSGTATTTVTYPYTVGSGYLSYTVNIEIDITVRLNSTMYYKHGVGLISVDTSAEVTAESDNSLLDGLISEELSYRTTRSLTAFTSGE
jgi:hypothetical protein